MGKPVLFVTGLGNSIKRSENIHVIYDAYQGEKQFISAGNPNFVNVAESGDYDLMVIDIFPTVKPKRAIMIWHAIQGGKYIGLDDKYTYYKPWYAEKMDRIVAAGRGGVDMFHRCTGVPREKILNLGMPRTDRYFMPRNVEPNPFFIGKRVYLYVPTFRAWHEAEMPDIDWKYIESQLTDDELLVVKSHPYGKQFELNGFRRIMEVYKMEPSVNFLYSADVVITDYSSIMFDAYLMRKPVVLFEKQKGYVQQRGMYLDYPDQYCSRYATNEQELVRLIRVAEGLTKTELDCVDYVADMCDGHSCERICKLINELK